MKKKLLAFIVVLELFVIHFSFAQAPLVKKWDYRFGGTKQEGLTSFIQTSDRGFILAGSSTSSVSGDKTQLSRGDWDYWIIKLDSNGLKQWDKRFGGAKEDDLLCIAQTRDGGYILGGSSYSTTGGDKTQPNWDSGLGTNDYWIVKIDAYGGYQWDKRFGTGDWDDLSSITQTSDGGYLLGGSTYGDAVDDKTQPNWDPTLYSHDYWIIKTDSAGNKQWDKRFGGTGDDHLSAVQQTSDGGFILGGHSFSGISGDKTEALRGGNDYWIVKIDATGNKQWDKTLGGTGADYLGSLQQTTDKGYILGGYTSSGIGGDKTQINYGGGFNFDFWVVKVDSLGNKTWDKDFGGTGDEDGFGNVYQTLDGGYLVAGSSYSAITGTKSELNSFGPEQLWITKTDAAGIKQWDKTIYTTEHDEIGYAIQTKQGCYVMANYTAANTGGYKTQPNWDATLQSCDYWIIKYCDTTATCALAANFNSSDTAFCNEGGQCIDFFDLSTCNPTSWKWSFPGASPDTSSLKNPTSICYSIPGTYAVQLVVSNANYTDTLAVIPMITFASGATAPVVTFSHDTLFSSQASAYQWYLNGAPIAGASDSIYLFTTDGSYAVYITDSLGCSRLGNAISVSVNELSGFKGIEIYPNPAGDQLKVYGMEFMKDATITILNVLGKSIYQGQWQFRSSGKHETVIDVSHLSSGIYFIRLSYVGKSLMTKFIKQ